VKNVMATICQYLTSACQYKTRKCVARSQLATWNEFVGDYAIFLETDIRLVFIKKGCG